MAIFLLLVRLRAVPLFRYFRAGNVRFLGLAEWRTEGRGVGRDLSSLSRARDPRGSTRRRFAAHFSLICWFEEEEETVRSLTFSVL